MKNLLRFTAPAQTNIIYFQQNGPSPSNVDRSTDTDIVSISEVINESGRDLNKLKDELMQTELTVKTEHEGAKGRLRVRNDEGKIVSRVEKGDKVTFVGETKITQDASGQNGETTDHVWFKVKTPDGNNGWVSSEYLVGEISTENPTEGSTPNPDQHTEDGGFIPSNGASNEEGGPIPSDTEPTKDVPTETFPEIDYGKEATNILTHPKMKDLAYFITNHYNTIDWSAEPTFTSDEQGNLLIKGKDGSTLTVDLGKMIGNDVLDEIKNNSIIYIRETLEGGKSHIQPPTNEDPGFIQNGEAGTNTEAAGADKPETETTPAGADQPQENQGSPTNTDTEAAGADQPETETTPAGADQPQENQDSPTNTDTEVAGADQPETETTPAGADQPSLSNIPGYKPITKQEMWESLHDDTNPFLEILKTPPTSPTGAHKPDSVEKTETKNLEVTALENRLQELRDRLELNDDDTPEMDLLRLEANTILNKLDLHRLQAPTDIPTASHGLKEAIKKAQENINRNEATMAKIQAKLDAKSAAPAKNAETKTKAAGENEPEKDSTETLKPITVSTDGHLDTNLREAIANTIPDNSDIAFTTETYGGRPSLLVDNHSPTINDLMNLGASTISIGDETAYQITTGDQEQPIVIVDKYANILATANTPEEAIAAIKKGKDTKIAQATKQGSQESNT